MDLAEYGSRSCKMRENQHTKMKWFRQWILWQLAGTLHGLLYRRYPFRDKDMLLLRTVTA